MSYEQRVKYRIRKFAKECGISVKELRKNMKDFGVTIDLYRWMEARMFNEEYHKNLTGYHRGDLEMAAEASDECMTCFNHFYGLS